MLNKNERTIVSPTSTGSSTSSARSLRSRVSQNDSLSSDSTGLSSKTKNILQRLERIHTPSKEVRRMPLIQSKTSEKWDNSTLNATVAIRNMASDITLSSTPSRSARRSAPTRLQLLTTKLYPTAGKPYWKDIYRPTMKERDQATKNKLTADFTEELNGAALNPIFDVPSTSPKKADKSVRLRGSIIKGVDNTSRNVFNTKELEKEDETNDIPLPKAVKMVISIVPDKGFLGDLTFKFDPPKDRAADMTQKSIASPVAHISPKVKTPFESPEPITTKKPEEVANITAASWSCNTCFVNNTGEKCACCGSLKEEKSKENKAPAQLDTGLSLFKSSSEPSKYSFGVAKTNQAEKAPNFAPTPSTSNPSSMFQPASEAPKSFTFRSNGEPPANQSVFRDNTSVPAKEEALKNTNCESIGKPPIKQIVLENHTTAPALSTSSSQFNFSNSSAAPSTTSTQKSTASLFAPTPATLKTIKIETPEEVANITAASWSCNTCFVNNTGEKCACCGSLKEGKSEENKAPAQLDTGLSLFKPSSEPSKYSFGVAKTNQAEKAPDFAPTPSTSKPSSVFQPASEAPKSFTFGSISEQSAKKNVFASQISAPVKEEPPKSFNFGSNSEPPVIQSVFRNNVSASTLSKNSSQFNFANLSAVPSTTSVPSSIFANSSATSVPSSVFQSAPKEEPPKSFSFGSIDEPPAKSIVFGNQTTAPPPSTFSSQFNFSNPSAVSFTTSTGGAFTQSSTTAGPSSVFQSTTTGPSSVFQSTTSGSSSMFQSINAGPSSVFQPAPEAPTNFNFGSIGEQAKTIVFGSNISAPAPSTYSSQFNFANPSVAPSTTAAPGGAFAYSSTTSGTTATRKIAIARRRLRK